MYHTTGIISNKYVFTTLAFFSTFAIHKCKKFGKTIHQQHHDDPACQFYV